MTLKRMLSLLLSLVLLLCTATALAQEDIQFDVTGYISEISSLNLAAHRGRTIAITFCSTSSSESLSQLTMWDMIANDFDPSQVSVFVVLSCYGGGEAELEELRQTYGLENVNLYADDGGSLCRLLGVTEFPNVLLLDRFGSPVSGYNGQISYDTIAGQLKALGARQLSNSYVYPEQ